MANRWYFILSTPGNSDELYVSEPTGWMDTSFEMVRDSRNHGISVAYASNDLEFVGEAADFISSKYEALGVDAEVNLRIRLKCGGELMYDETFALDFGSYKRKNGNEGCSVNIGFEQSSCFQQFNANYDKKVDVDSETTFDGTPVISLPELKKTVAIPATRLQRSVDGSVGENAVDVYDVGNLNTSVKIMLRPTFLVERYNNMNAGYLVPTEGYGIYPDNPGYAREVSPFYRRETDVGCFDGVYQYRFRLKGDLFMKSQRSTDWIAIQQSLLVIKKVGSYYDNSTPVVILHQYHFPSNNTITNAGETYAFDVDWSGETTLQEDEYISVFLLTDSFGNFSFSPLIELRWDSISEGRVTALQRCAPSNADLYHPLETLQRCTDIISDGCLKVESSYYGRQGTIGCGAYRMLTTGLHLRNAPLAKFFTSFKDLIEGLSPIDAIGFGLQTDATGEEVLHIETLDFFYQDEEIFSAEYVGQVQVQVNGSEVIGTIRVGYDKWQAEEVNGLDEFNSTREYRTATRNAKATFDIVSKFIASSYMIELSRQQSYALTGAADTRYDNETFILQCQYDKSVYVYTKFINSTPGKIRVPASTAYITSGNTIRIEDSRFNDGNYTIASVSVDVNEWVVTLNFPIVAEVDTTVKITLLSGIGVEVFSVEEGGRTVTGAIDPKTIKNLRLSPVRNLMRWWRWIAGIAFRNAEDAASQLIFTQGTGNYLLQGRLLDDCSPEGVILKEDATIVEETFKSHIYPQPLVRAESVSFEYPMSLSEFMTLRANPYGYVSYQDKDGVWYAGYINKLTYRMNNAMANFNLRNSY